MRAMERSQTIGRFRVGDWMIDPAIDEIATGDRTHKLEPRTMRLLVALAQAGGGVVSSERLLDEVWSGVVVGPASVYQSVSQLRKVLGDSESAPRFIATVPRKGYRLLAPVEWLGGPLAAGPVAAPVAAPDAAPPVSGSRPLARRASDLHRSRVARGVAATGAAAALAVLAWWQWPRVESPTIAVLPFVDLSPEGGQQVFSDGLSEELSNWLAQTAGLRVVARTSAFAFRGRDEDVRKIGRELAASHVLEGSVRRTADRVRVTAQLVDARTGYQVWSQSIDRPFVDVVAIQDDIAQAVTAALERRLSPRDRQRIIARSPSSARAYELYLLANEAYRQRTARDNARALSLFDGALALDPQFSLALAGRAAARINDIYLAGASREAALADAGTYVARAIAVAPEMPEVLAVRATLSRERRRYDAAIADLDRAIASNPNSVDALTERGRLYESLGRPRDALASIERAAGLDPLDFLRHVDLCSVRQDLGEFAAADEACARARALEPQGPWSTLETAYLHLEQGELDQAWRWLALAGAERPHDALLLGLRADVLCQLGLAVEARAFLEEERAQADDRERIDVGIGQAVLLAGGTRAFEGWLSGTSLTVSARAEILLNAANLQAMAGNEAAATELVARARAAADFDPSIVAGPDYIRGGTAAAPLLIHVAALRGDEAGASRERAAFAAALAGMERNGEAGYGLRVMRAESQALAGESEAAVGSLREAFERGWRGIAWVSHSPWLAPLRERADYRALESRVKRALETLREPVRASIVQVSSAPARPVEAELAAHETP
jgi:TolB-like protein/DNA-binding winged helix-turn-helix (wHTH) protein/Tfp pilus assembly protein PilF